MQSGLIFTLIAWHNPGEVTSKTLLTTLLNCTSSVPVPGSQRLSFAPAIHSTTAPSHSWLQCHWFPRPQTACSQSRIRHESWKGHKKAFPSAQQEPERMSGWDRWFPLCRAGLMHTDHSKTLALLWGGSPMSSASLTASRNLGISRNSLLVLTRARDMLLWVVGQINMKEDFQELNKSWSTYTDLNFFPTPVCV